MQQEIENINGNVRDDSRIANSDMHVEHDRSVPCYHICDLSSSLLHRPNSEAPSPTRTSAGDARRMDKFMRVSKSSMVDAIKVRLTKLLGASSLGAKERKNLTRMVIEDLEIPLGGVKKKLLPWTTLPKILSERGWQLENWPREVPLPGSGNQSCDDNKGVNGLNKRYLSLLYEAVISKDHPLKFSRIAHASGSINVTHDLGDTFAPDSTDIIAPSSISVTPLNSSCRRARSEDDGEGSRADKRPRLIDD